MKYKPTFPNVLVVGMHFRPRGKEIAANLLPPVAFELEREPDNQYDSFAIKVMYAGEHIGYIERGQAAFIATYMDDGVKYSCVAEEFRQVKNNLHPVVTVAPVDDETATD